MNHLRPLLLFMSLLASAPILATPEFHSRPCADAELQAVARCGYVRVAENRSKKAGRTIDLNIIVLPATSLTPDLPALVDLDGGPGLASTRSAGFYLAEGIDYRRRREVVLIDQRGTGGSNPLLCPELAAKESAGEVMYPPLEVARCRRVLSRKADLTQYGTSAAVADLDEVRVALGQSQIDIVALSYGTTLALRYLAMYSNHVHAAVLLSVVPTTALPPQRHATFAQDALERILAQCVEDIACHAAFPAPTDDLKRTVARLRARKGNPLAAVVLENLRTQMYQPLTARKIPYLLHRAAEGDLAPLLALTMASGASSSADGLYLSITCSESIALMDFAAAATVARATIFGDYRLSQQRAACRKWPAAQVAMDYLDPVVSSTPTLLISGGLDPVSPAVLADEVARHLTNARQLLIPASGHVFDGLSEIDTCYDPLVVRFLENADPMSVDASCLAQMRPPPFMTQALSQ